MKNGQEKWPPIDAKKRNVFLNEFAASLYAVGNFLFNLTTLNSIAVQYACPSTRRKYFSKISLTKKHNHLGFLLLFPHFIKMANGEKLDANPSGPLRLRDKLTNFHAIE